MMMEFQREYPQIDFQLFNGDYHDVDRWLTDGSVDIAFITLPTEVKCRVIPLYEDPLVAILPKNHPLAVQPVCRVEDVAKEDFISLLEASNHDARRALDAVNMKPNVRFRTKDDYAVIAMVRQGLGVSISRRCCCAETGKILKFARSIRRQAERLRWRLRATIPAPRRACDCP